jgi:hypothetical protein
MTHPAYLLARLNPKNVRFDIGSGGTAELTPQDIAACLALVPAGLGRELLQITWWPDSRGKVIPKAIDHMTGMLLVEWSARESAMLDAMLAIASSAGRDSLRRAQAMYSNAHSNRWPAISVVDKDIRSPTRTYLTLPHAVLTEVTRPSKCVECDGRGDLVTRTGLAKCTRCDGCGTGATKNTERAEALGITESNYRMTWDGPYNWLLDHCNDLLRAAAKALSYAAA